MASVRRLSSIGRRLRWSNVVPKAKQPTRRERWAPYVRLLGDILHLQDWRLDVSEESPNGVDSIASCAPIYGRKYAVIRLAESFLTDDPIEQRHTLTHELFHCHFAPMMRLLEATESFGAAEKLSMEYFVDGMADAIAPLLPMPPASTKSQH
jgi:hypothetical protein